MDLKELRSFRVIAELGTFSKAGAFLRVAQPALSRQIRNLEHELGVELLTRTSKGVTLTPAGQSLLKRTSHIEQEIENAKREASGYADAMTGSLRIAFQYPQSESMAAELIKAYRARFPLVTLYLLEGFTGDLTDALLNDELDIAVMDPPSHMHSNLLNMPLWVDTMCLIGPPSPAFAAPFEAQTLTLSDLVDLPIISPNPSSAIRRLINNAFARKHLTFRPIMEVTGPHLIGAMLQAEIGYTIFPPTTFYHLQSAGLLKAREVSPAILRTVSIVTRQQIFNEPIGFAIISMMKDAAVQLLKTKRFATSSIYLEKEPIPLSD